MKRVISAVVVLIGLAAPARAGFDEGVAAYERGDYETALREFRPLAEQGNARAQFFLGSMYEIGKGVTQDYAEAARWYRKGAEQGLYISQLFLAGMYEIGKGVTQDYAEAVRWYRKAAEQGDAAQAVKGLLTGRKKDRLPSKLAKVATEVSRRDGAWRGPRCGQRNPGIALGV